MHLLILLLFFAVIVFDLIIRSHITRLFLNVLKIAADTQIILKLIRSINIAFNQTASNQQIIDLVLLAVHILHTLSDIYIFQIIISISFPQLRFLN